MKGQINLEFLSSALVFLLALGALITIGSDILPSFSEQLTVSSTRMEAYTLSSQLIEETGFTESGGSQWSKTDSRVRNLQRVGLVKNQNQSQYISEQKINRLRSIDIGLSGEYLNYTEFKDITGAKNQYLFNFTWKPILYSSESFIKTPRYEETPNLQAYYELEEGSGNVVDSSKNGRSGTNTGAEREKKGAFSSDSFKFEYGDWISLEDNFTVNSDVSISLWVRNNQKWDSNGDYFLIMGNDEGADRKLRMGVENGNLSFKYRNSTGEYGILDEDEPSLNEWVHITGTYNHSSGIWRMYVNGNQVESKYDPVNIDLDNQDDNYINRGEGENGIQRGLEGKIDEIRIYNSTIDNKRVEKLHSIKSKIRQPENPRYNLDSEKAFYGSKELRGETHYYLITPSESAYVSNDWNFTSESPKLKSEPYTINGETYRVEEINIEDSSAAITISQHLKSFGSNVDSDSSVIRLLRYSVMRGKPLEVEVLAW